MRSYKLLDGNLRGGPGVLISAKMMSRMRGVTRSYDTNSISSSSDESTMTRSRLDVDRRTAVLRSGSGVSSLAER